MKLLQLKLGLLIVLLLTGISPSFAGLEEVYICTVRYNPMSTYPGNNYIPSGGAHGYLFVSLYSGPNCTGSFDKYTYVCTLGATSPACSIGSNAGHTGFHRTEAQILMEYDLLVKHANAGIKVSHRFSRCIGEASGWSDCTLDFVYGG